jgi:uncharacterized protein (DUF1330 family)
MSAYVISEVEVKVRQASRPIGRSQRKPSRDMGGRYLVRGGPARVAEGGPPPKTIIVIEFPSMQRLHEWYASSEYAEALKVRQTVLERRLIFVEGVPA